MDTNNNLHKRGFGGMSKAKRVAVARKGGQNSQASGRGHRWTSATARKHFEDKK